jgi:uracil-DNA glycosylase
VANSDLKPKSGIPREFAANKRGMIKIMKPLPVSAADFIPPGSDWDELKEAAKDCKGCPLYRDATQVVFGEGPRPASLMLVGTMPGDAEDKQGHPFVGPAGRILDQALAEAHLSRSDIYITNAVKHFKFVETGRYRLHRNPGGREILACKPWLEAELKMVRPALVVALGTLAIQSLLGKPTPLHEVRGHILTHLFGGPMLATVHPSAILRLRGAEADFRKEYRHFVRDLKQADRYLNTAEFKRAA